MKKLLLKILQTSMAVALVVGTFFAATPPDQKHLYQASVLKENLLRNIPSPRIIVFGGSNIAFGIDSKSMEKELGIPVINDGLHVGLGVAPLNELGRYIRAGDIIIISLEYYNFTDEISFWGQPSSLADWIEFSPARIFDVHRPLQQAPGLLTILFQRKVNRLANYYLYGFSLDAGRGFYTGDKFNEHGDFIGHLGDQSDASFKIPDSVYPINYVDAAYIYLEEFNQFARSKGATVYYEAQAHRQTNCELTGAKNLKTFFNRLSNKTTIPLLTNTEELCLPDDYFYDTPYHLNEQGRKMRTERLIESLKLVLGN